MNFLSVYCSSCKKIENLKQNSHSFLSFTLISLFLSVCFPCSFSIVKLPSSKLGFTGRFPQFLNCSNVHRLTLDLNLSQNQSHSQATQPFCIPISPVFVSGWKRLLNASERHDSFSNTVWWILGGDRLFICIILVKLSSTVFGRFYWGAHWVNWINFIQLHLSTKIM